MLLDFLKQLNEPDGPMEEYRLAYAPTLYTLTRLAIDLQLVARHQFRDNKQSYVSLVFYFCNKLDPHSE